MPTKLCPGPMTRRGLIRHSIAASLGYALGRNFIPSAWAAEEDEGMRIRSRPGAPSEYVVAEGRAQHVVLVWMNGGPAHLDTFDPKPGTRQAGGIAAVEAAKGLQICSYLPRLAKMGKHLCLLRGVHSQDGDHSRGTYLMHTGYREISGVEYPSLGSIVCAEAKEGPQSDLPGYISLNGRGGGSGFYGAKYSPLSTYAGAEIPNIEPPLPHKLMDSRLAALDVLDSRFAAHTQSEFAETHNEMYGRAVRFSRSSLAKLLDPKSTDAKTLSPYGNTSFSRACYTAKRLISEGGVRFIEIEHSGWDIHSNNTYEVARQCSTFDQPLGRLIEELSAEGLLSKTLIIALGEFGRSPDISGGGGRDHYPKCFSIMLAGGGVKGGQAVGSSNKTGHEPTGSGISVPDFFHSVCAACGIDAAKFRDSNEGRPIRIADRGSKLIEGIFG